MSSRSDADYIAQAVERPAEQDELRSVLGYVVGRVVKFDHNVEQILPTARAALHAALSRMTDKQHRPAGSHLSPSFSGPVRIRVDNGAWGADDPLVIVLGFARGTRQSRPLPFDRIAFAGMRAR